METEVVTVGVDLATTGVLITGTEEVIGTEVTGVEVTGVETGVEPGTLAGVIQALPTMSIRSKPT